ncbi:MAG: outer membrane beta-barrel protein, partial [Flavobacteriaceae bacterium]|nr:outer membrane beta-barrel protein [Flavobacteriaceae bacterium]
MQKLYSLLLITLFTISSIAQNGNMVSISGTVYDKDVNQPLEYATVSFTDSSTNEIVNGGITNLEGKFDIKVPTGNYTVTVEYISYETKTFPDQNFTSDTDLGRIAIGINVEALDAVEVIAERTTVEIKLDKKIYNIGRDITTSGGTVSDALNNVPSVSVDIDGAISLRGNGNVRILINGKPSALAGFGDTNLLSQLPAEAIERVEVITSPSARYDAEGTAGILNIILRQKETLGFNGSVNFNIGHPDNIGLNSNINYRTEDYNLFSNLGYRYFDAPRTGFSDTDYLRRFREGEVIEPEFDRIREDNNVDRLNRNYNANVGMEYFLNEQSSITGSMFFRYGEDADTGINDSKRYNNGNLVEETIRREIQTEKDNSYQFSLNYINRFNDEGHELTVDLQFETDAEDQRTRINEDYVFGDEDNQEPFQREFVFTEEDQKEYLVQADYILPIGEDSRFEAGYRGNFENEITDYQLEQEDLVNGGFFINDTLTNVFDYSENVNALYTQYGSKFGKFSFLLGLRLENT